MAEPWAYRNKGHFRVSKAEGNISLGFYEEASHKQVQESCRHLFSQAVVELLDSLPDLLEQHQVPIASDAVSYTHLGEICRDLPFICNDSGNFLLTDKAFDGLTGTDLYTLTF